MAGEKKSRKKPTMLGIISPEELLREFPGAKKIAHEPGSLIFREGSPAGCCYVITRGQVEILKKTRKGENVALAKVRPGEFLGEMAMLSGEKRSASAKALTRVEAIVIEHTEFVAQLKAQNAFACRLLLQLSTLLATRCHRLLRLIARQPEVIPMGAKASPPLDVRAVLNRVYTLWAV
ncbi:MAG: cyclic nucleotide-binding domain-containing protein [Methylacidiphilales bacterium]|nr:cyclic nucleotide-binding domain-containing protein [Candidatus Methylacidiphilales bacterium]